MLSNSDAPVRNSVGLELGYNSLHGVVAGGYLGKVGGDSLVALGYDARYSSLDAAADSGNNDLGATLVVDSCRSDTAAVNDTEA